MIAIAGGKAIIGSAENEVGRKKDEGPVHTVELDDFWIGKHITTPTPPFTDMSFGMDKNGYPALKNQMHGGLYNMHGNVAECTLDQCLPEKLKNISPGNLKAFSR